MGFNIISNGVVIVKQLIFCFFFYMNMLNLMVEFRSPNEKQIVIYWNFKHHFYVN